MALRYRSGLTPLQNGHYTVYHDDLRAAAGRLGHELVILAGVGSAAAPGVIPCLAGDDPAAIATALGPQLAAGDVVMVYEGSLGLLEALVPVATTHPDVTLVVNLFRPEPGLDGGPDPSRHGVLGARLPDNLRVTAETPERVVLARAAGLPVRAAWALHSIVATVDAPPSGWRTADAGPLRILVPLRPGGFDAGPVADLAHVAHRLGRLAGRDAFRFTVTRHGTGRLTAQVRGDRLARSGVALVEPSARTEEYAGMFGAHDAVWIVGSYATSPAAYRTQSSGKALDALVAGLPVVGVAGGSPVRESLRWTGVPLGYRDREEAVQVLLGLRDRIAALHAALDAQRDEIRRAHSPEATLARVLAVAEDPGDGRGAPILDRAADLSPDAGRFLPGPTDVVPPRRGRRLAAVHALRTARIPLHLRLRFAARRRLSGTGIARLARGVLR